jgi:hypothetical protein
VSHAEQDPRRNTDHKQPCHHKRAGRQQRFILLSFLRRSTCHRALLAGLIERSNSQFGNLFQDPDSSALIMPSDAVRCGQCLMETLSSGSERIGFSKPSSIY